MTALRSGVVVGAGGHAKVVIDTLRAGGWEVVAAFDDDPAKHGALILRVPIRGTVEEGLARPEAVHLAIGDNGTRRRVAEAAGRSAWASAVHPFAHLAEGVALGDGVLICAGAILQPDASG